MTDRDLTPPAKHHRGFLHENPEGFSPLLEGDASVATSSTLGTASATVFQSPSRGGRLRGAATQRAKLLLCLGFQWRTAVEQQVQRAADGGVRSIVIRPAVVYGNGGGIPKRMVDDAQRLGGAYCIGEGGNRWPFVHIDDLADLYRRAIESAAAGSLFYAVSGDSIQLRLLAEKVSHAAGTKGRVISMTLEAP